MAKSARASKPPAPGTKSAFILAQPASLPARDVVARAKARGISTTVQSVQVCRSHARRRGLLPPLATTASKANGHATKAKPKKVVIESPAQATTPARLSDAEKKLLELAIAVGMPRAVHLVLTLQNSYAATMARVIAELS